MRDRTKPYEENEDSLAAIGIGAMIVFIALILVAAVASTIIIKTAEELQQRAEATGDDTRESISGKLEIISAFVNGNTGGNVDNVLVFAQVSSGSDSILTNQIRWVIVCDGGATAGVDSSLVSASTVTQIGGTALVSTTLNAGDSIQFFIDTSAGNCAAAVNQHLELHIIVNGGGETYAQLEVNSITEGDPLV